MTVDTRRIKRRRRLPAGFLGFSTEWPNAPLIAGRGGTDRNPVAEGLWANLRAAGSGGPTLRVGGSSAEQTWWNPGGAQRPAGIKFDIDEFSLGALKSFRDRNASALVLTLNLAHADPSTAVELARAAVRVLGPGGVRSYELGNEPDTYSSFTYYQDAQGRNVKQRGPGYSFGDYQREYGARAALLRSQVGALPLTGPSACCAEPFIKPFPSFLAQQRPYLGQRASLHEYFGAACPSIKPGTPGYATRRKLLGPDDMKRIIAGFRTAVSQGARAGKQVEVTETNSFACGGQPGVSDAFTSALWAAEYTMRTAGAGVVGANFHTFGRAYSPFDFRQVPGVGYVGNARPLYYGLLLFARATANRATLLLGTRARVRKGSNAVAFPTLDGRTLRVLVLAKSARRGGIVRIAVPRGARVGRISRLRARGLGARGGVTLAGQSVAPDSRTGFLTGTRRFFAVRRRGGAYRFSMPAAAGALLEVKIRR